jgi:hypothetical protein
MIINKVSPVDLKYHPDFNIILAYMTDMFTDKSLKIMKEYNVYRIEALQENIIRHIIGTLDLSKEINNDI